MTDIFQGFLAELQEVRATQRIGRVARIAQGTLSISHLADIAVLGDELTIEKGDGRKLRAEIIGLSGHEVTALPEGDIGGCALQDRVLLRRDNGLAVDSSWLGRIIDPFGKPLDDAPLRTGAMACPLRAAPPPATARRGLGARLETGLCVFNTFLPLARGQRIGIFAGSGVGKTTLLADLAKGITADVVVIAMIGERGREVRAFAESALGPEGLARSVIIAATSDESPLVRRRAAWAAMTVAEYFRAAGAHVLLVMDSITRLAEAHRDVALAAGEAPAARGFPASTHNLVTALAERAGPGTAGEGDITAIFSVLVAGSDMDEPVADMLRGVLDGHVILDREIAERGRFPAIDLRASVSRSLPGVATEVENTLISKARHCIGTYAKAEMMIQAGLYAAGSDPAIDEAIRVWPALDAFISEREDIDTAASFGRLNAILSQAGPGSIAPRHRAIAT